jgi:hypothetical protein
VVEQEMTIASADESRDAVARATHATWAPGTWAEAWQRVRFTSDLMRAPIAAFARDAANMGLLHAPAPVDVGTLFPI